MIVFLIIASVLTAVVFLYLRQEKFGRAPQGERLERIRKSPHYRDGSFQNQHPTPTLTEGYSMIGVLTDYLFTKHPKKKPLQPLPSVKTDLSSLAPDEDVLIWFGHSSYFIQLDGKKILVDPVFSGNASPLPGTNKAFSGTDIYTTEELPVIDYLLLTHDHYDHVDYETLLQLKSKVSLTICGLGVGEHLERWGYNPSKIIEKDWYEQVTLSEGFTLHIKPARHFSGRGLTRNNTLWCSYLLLSPSMRIYIGGDSGYDTHYREIEEQHGPVDLAILDNGQYDRAWQYIHHLPNEVLQAATDLKAKRILPVHSSKFVLANHAWNDPLEQITQQNSRYQKNIITPMIGEKVDLNDSSHVFSAWWRAVE